MITTLTKIKPRNIPKYRQVIIIMKARSKSQVNWNTINCNRNDF